MTETRGGLRPLSLKSRFKSTENYGGQLTEEHSALSVLEPSASAKPGSQHSKAQAVQGSSQWSTLGNDGSSQMQTCETE